MTRGGNKKRLTWIYLLDKRDRNWRLKKGEKNGEPVNIGLMPLLTNYHLFSFFFHSLNIPYFGRFSFPLRYNGPIYFSLLLNLFVTSVGINNEIYTQLSKNTRQRASPDATFPSPDDKEDDGGALTGTGYRPDYRAADSVAIVVKTGVS